MLGIGGWEMVLILAVFLILFGPKKLPEFARGLGQSIKEFKKAGRDVVDEIQNAVDDHQPPHPPTAPPKALPEPPKTEPRVTTSFAEVVGDHNKTEPLATTSPVEVVGDHKG